MPVYNVENYLERCLSSLLNQTIGFDNLEIIFIDDVSEDNSYKLDALNEVMSYLRSLQIKMVI